MRSQKRVSYFYNGNFDILDSISQIDYGSDHPMKPKRIAMTHQLIVSFELYRHLDKPHFASNEEMQLFHNPEYINYLESSCTKINNFIKNNMIISDENKKNQFKIDLTTDCPVFHGLYEFCQLSTGGSIDAAYLLAENHCDLAINWAGGLHHAKKSEASGFCYVNDIVCAILVLLQYYQRVLYIDLDVHHGDGVEEAFLCTNRVMTVSFHEFGDGFFPGSGNYDQIGEGQGRGYSLNIPLKQGITDDLFIDLFKNVMKSTIDHYRPSIIVLQCGADSIAHDLLGHFNLSSKGHGECVDFVINQGYPTMILGGGGYTIENVSRLWAYETSIALNQYLPNQIPQNDKYIKEYNKNDLKLDILVKFLIQPEKDVENLNTKQDIQILQQQVYNSLKLINQAPNIDQDNDEPMQRPYEIFQVDMDEEDIDNLASLGKDATDQTKIGLHKTSQRSNILL